MQTATAPAIPAQARRFVRTALELELRPFALEIAEREAAASADTFNFLKAGVFTADERAQQGLGRSIDSKLGNRYESIAHRLAFSQFAAKMPQAVFADGVSAADVSDPVVSRYLNGAGKTALWCRYDESAVRREAGALVKWIEKSGAKIGTKAFQSRFEDAWIAVREAPLAEEPWAWQLDLYVASPELGMIEMKAGGYLDNSKAEIEVQGLIVAALINDDPSIPIRFVCCYANNGEGRRISGALATYFTHERLLVGSSFWERILPEGVSFDDFVSLCETVGQAARSSVAAAS